MVGFFVGVGVIFNEIGDVSCNDVFCFFDEFSSIWYKWICDEFGLLVFVFILLNLVIDFDFVFYEFFNGFDDCIGK